MPVRRTSVWLTLLPSVTKHCTEVTQPEDSDTLDVTDIKEETQRGI